MLATIRAALLGVPRVGRHDHGFELGRGPAGKTPGVMSRSRDILAA
jgi:hypothetical protein